MKLIPSEIIWLITQSYTSTSEPSKIVQVLEQGCKFWTESVHNDVLIKNYHFHAEMKHIKRAVTDLRRQNHWGIRRH